MNFDFSALLLGLTVLSGLIWGIDALLFAPARREYATDPDGNVPEPLMVEYARSFFPIFLIVLILRSFIVEPFRIPSASMMPTLLCGDFILVNKYDYGIRLPVINKKIIDVNSPETGDVIVFRNPEDHTTPFIKRVVGTPGDRVSYRNKVIYINDMPISLQSKGGFDGQCVGKRIGEHSLIRETLGGVEHDILINPDSPFSRLAAPIDELVPEGHYFVMGDNRDNSSDSRVWGFVPDDHIIGHAFMIWMNWDMNNSSIMNWIDWKRIGTMF